MECPGDGSGLTFIMLVLWSRIRWRMRNAATDTSLPLATKRIYGQKPVISLATEVRQEIRIKARN